MNILVKLVYMGINYEPYDPCDVAVDFIEYQSLRFRDGTYLFDYWIDYFRYVLINRCEKPCSYFAEDDGSGLLIDVDKDSITLSSVLLENCSEELSQHHSGYYGLLAIPLTLRNTLTIQGRIKLNKYEFVKLVYQFIASFIEDWNNLSKLIPIDEEFNEIVLKFYDIKLFLKTNFIHCSEPSDIFTLERYIYEPETGKDVPIAFYLKSY